MGRRNSKHQKLQFTSQIQEFNKVMDSLCLPLQSLNNYIAQASLI